MKIGLTILFMFFGLATMAKEQIDCDQVWRDVGHIVVVDRPVLASPQIPEFGVIEGFVIKTIGRKSGGFFHPRTIEEGMCTVDIMLDNKTRNALRSGLKDYMCSTPSNSVEEKVDKLADSINRRLDALYTKSGMTSGLGELLIQIQIEQQFGYVRWGGEDNYGLLQTKAVKEGVRRPILFADWIWFNYLEHLDESEFESDEFIDYLKD